MRSSATIPPADQRAARRAVAALRRALPSGPAAGHHRLAILSVCADDGALRGEAAFPGGGAPPAAEVRSALRPLLARPGLENARLDVHPGWSLLRVGGLAAVVERRPGTPVEPLAPHRTLADALRPFAARLADDDDGLLLARLGSASGHERMAMAAAHAACGWTAEDAYGALIGFTTGPAVRLLRRRGLALVAVADPQEPGGLAVPVVFGL